MPAALTYPGVYIEEIPSGVRAIVGVATSITAFVGRAKRGETDRATVINGFGDFEREFGGLWLSSKLGYAVRDFFLNGGGQAIVVRLYRGQADLDLVKDATKQVADAATGADAAAAAAAATAKATALKADNKFKNSSAAGSAMDAVVKAATDAAAANGATAATVQTAAQGAAASQASAGQPKSTLTAGGLPLEAASEGSWGAYLRASVDKTGTAKETADALGVQQSDLFNLTVRDSAPNGQSERFLNLTVVESARRVDRVLKEESNLVRYSGTLDPTAPPTITGDANSSDTAGDDPVTQKEKALAAAQKALTQKLLADPNADVTNERQAVTTAQAALDAANKTARDSVSDGQSLNGTSFLPDGGSDAKKGLYALLQADLFNLLCIPPYRTSDGIAYDVDTTVIAAATTLCEARRAMFLIDSPSNWDSKGKVIDGNAGSYNAPANDYPGVRSKNAALFFPRIRQPNPLREDRVEEFVPCGAIAGVFARTDTQRGVWKAPAGLDATLVNVPELEVNLSDAENGELNPLGVNCLRTLPITGRVVWGARTLRGADQLADEWKYIPVRRTALYIEESLFRGTQWVVFEPNDEPLWAEIRMNVGAFMQGLFRQGAFQGSTPREAYFVKCDRDTTTQADIDRGIVNIVVGFAPLKPAEFVVIKLQQMAGQIQT